MVKSEPNYVCVDGCWAISDAAYRMNDIAFIFPITPSSPMGEFVDDWWAEDRNNVFGQPMKVTQMQSEGGAAGALHGALVAGSLATTFTASQGLLLMIPNMYKIAGEMLPCVMHIASRSIAGQALSIYGDHNDIMAARATGFAIVGSFSVQESHDIAAITQVATLKSRVPILHYMDGFRTSHEINKIQLIPDETLREMMPMDAIREHRARAMSPMHPTQRGTAQGPDVYMQLVETSNTYYTKFPGILEDCFKEFSEKVGREYKLYEYYGAEDAEYVVVVMGSGYVVARNTVEYINRTKDHKVGVLGIRMFRPWLPESFCDALPKTVKGVAVLDRTKEAGSQGEPLFLEVATTLNLQGLGHINVIGGRYGLSSKDFNPRMAYSVFSNLWAKEPKKRFTVGINDDVTYLSLNLGRAINLLDESVKQCVFWGFGSDGTVGGNKNAIKIIGNFDSEFRVQGYFEYDAKKSGGLTVSYLRFAKGKQIDAPYKIDLGQANYVACHNESYVQAHKYDVIKFLNKGGTFLLNTTAASIEDPVELHSTLEKLISPQILRTIYRKKAKFFIIDAGKIANQFGLSGKINMICMTAFFRLSGVLPFKEAIALLKNAIKKTYSYKGDAVVQKNYEIVDTIANDTSVLKSIEPPKEWGSLKPKTVNMMDRNVVDVEDQYKGFVTDILEAANRFEGDSIPVSAFINNGMLGGIMPPGTTKYEKRTPNPSGKAPVWVKDNCTQCNKCVFVCPHAVIRPFVVTPEEAKNAPHPEAFETLRAQGSELAGKRYTLRISTLDCTGCNACVQACPEGPKALQMEDLAPKLKTEVDNWKYAKSLPDRGDMVDKTTVKGSQFQMPLMEFSGACAGCGETPYFKLITQLFGERLVIANATGCTTIWGGSFPGNPYTVNKKGRGPAWGNSLFEDNAEYGLGMWSAMRHRRDKLSSCAQKLVDMEGFAEKYSELNEVLTEWLAHKEEKSDRCTRLHDKAEPLLLRALKESNEYTDLVQGVFDEKDLFPKLSQWITGGDGWAYDIGYGGLDHIEAFSKNDVNVFVVDTEMYSNTGGQSSKASSLASLAKFSMSGRTQQKKNIGEIFMSYGHVYVASVCLSNMPQLVAALTEAEAYNGPSFVVAYAPCIEQGIRPNGLNDMYDEMNMVVDTGYWPLYRYNPDLVKQGKNPFILDSKKLKRDLVVFLERENRFINLKKRNPELAEGLRISLNRGIVERLEKMKFRATHDFRFDTDNKAQGIGTVLVLYGSETGTAKHVANEFADQLSTQVVKELTDERLCFDSVKCEACDDVELDDLVDPNIKLVVLFVATCGQGALPGNCASFYDALKKADADSLKGVKLATFGLGDTSYYFFCKAAKDIETRMIELGAEAVMPLGTGDECAEGGLEGELEAWYPEFFKSSNIPAPDEEQAPREPTYQVTYSQSAVMKPEQVTDFVDRFYIKQGAAKVSCVGNKLMTDEEYAKSDLRDFRHFRFDCPALSYELGDSLEIYASNDLEITQAFLSAYSPDTDPRAVVNVKSEHPGVQGEVTLECLFQHVFDVFGKPDKKFFGNLAMCAEDAAQKTTLQDMSQGFGEKYEAFVKSTKTFADALLEFDSARPPLPVLFDMLPLIKPRAYSIASAPSMHGDVIELCVVINQWRADQVRTGLCTNYMRQFEQGTKLYAKIKPSSMDPPEVTQPVVAVGIGSGLAPHMCFLYDRVKAARDGETVEEFHLYFGNRRGDKEYLYREELEGFEKEFDWFKLNVAFSRDDPNNRVYVQHLVEQDVECYKQLVEKKGMLYVCGNRNLPKPLQGALVKCFMKANPELDEAGAKAKMEEMFVKGRAQQEVW